MSKHRGKEQDLIFRHLTICVSGESALLCVLVPAAGPAGSLTAEFRSGPSENPLGTSEASRGLCGAIGVQKSHSLFPGKLMSLAQ